MKVARDAGEVRSSAAWMEEVKKKKKMNGCLVLLSPSGFVGSS